MPWTGWKIHFCFLTSTFAQDPKSACQISFGKSGPSADIVKKLHTFSLYIYIYTLPPPVVFSTPSSDWLEVEYPKTKQFLYTLSSGILLIILLLHKFRVNPGSIWDKGRDYTARILGRYTAQIPAKVYPLKRKQYQIRNSVVSMNCVKVGTTNRRACPQQLNMAFQKAHCSLTPLLAIQGNNWKTGLKIPT